MDSELTLFIELLHDDAQPPKRATSGSAGYDLTAYLKGRTVKCARDGRTWDEPERTTDDDASLVLPPATTALVPLGFKARLPMGIEAQIRPRSGLAFKKGLEIPNAPVGVQLPQWIPVK